MAGLLDLFSGRSSDIYGEGLLTPEQRGGLGNIGLLALAGKLGQLAGPSFSPVPDFGAALGQAAGAYGASQEGAGTAALNAILTGQKGRKLQQELEFGKQIPGTLAEIMRTLSGLGSGGGEGEGSGSTGGGAAAPLGAGGGGAPGASGAGGTITLDQARQAAVNAGFTGPAIDIAAATGMAESSGNPLAHNTKGEDSYGYMQLNADAHGDKVKTFDLQQQMNHAFAISKQGTDFSPWTMYRNGQYKKYLSLGGAAPTAAAPADSVRVPYNYGAPGGGLLAPTAPNPLSDAEPMVGIPRPAAGAAGAAAVAPNRVGRFAGVAPGTPVNSGGFPYNPEITDPAVAARVAQSMAAIKQAQQSGQPWYAPRETSSGDTAAPGQGALAEEPPGFAGRQLVAQLLARPPLDDVSQYRQVAGPGAADAAPRAPLPTMGPTGVELPPMQGPLAARAPAAAAPAAPGPGLLAPPGAPAAALPQVNPGYDAIARQIAGLRVRARLAGLPDVFEALQSGLTSSPAYQAQVELAKRLGVLPLIGPEETAKRTAGLPFISRETTARAGAEQPFLLQRDAFKNALDNLANGRIYDETTGSFKSVPGFNRTLAEQEQAKAVGSKSQDTTEMTVRGADGRDYKQLIPQTDLAQKLREQPPAIPGQPVAPGTIVGARQAGPLDTLGIETLKEAGVAAQGAYKRIQDYGQLAQAAQGFTTGPTTEKWFEVKRYLKDLGVISGTEVPDQEIFQLAQKRLQAAAAPKGQGSTSDYERSLFSSGLASMATSREGLARAIAIANRLDQYDVQVAQIHEDVARQNRGYPDYLAVQQRLRELGPPLSESEKAALQGIQSGRSAAAPELPFAATPQDAAKLPPNTLFRDPTGTTRRVPQPQGQ